MRLRRLWSATPRRPGDPNPVEMSSVLVVEACARGADGGHEVSVGDVARFADVEHSTASRLVDRAARSGLLDRTPSAGDSRRTALVLTPAGRKLRARSVAFRTAWLTGILDGWDIADVHTFAGLLDRFAALVVARGGPGPLDG